MKINKKIIEYILSEVDKTEEYREKFNTHKPVDGRLIVKLLYYEKSVWEKESVPASSVIIDADLTSVLNRKKDKTADKAKDSVIPFILVLDGGYTGAEAGQVYQVSRSRVTGEVYNPDFLNTLDMIQKDRSSLRDGKPMLEKVKTPEEKLNALVQFWGKYQLETPWYVSDDETTYADTLFYEIAEPELRGLIDLEKLKALL